MELKMLAIKRLRAGEQYRRAADDESGFEELKRSIADKGVLFPLLVTEKNDTYEIIDGRRRYEACRSLKMEGDRELPALVIKTDAGQSVETALIANSVRADADPLAEAEAVNLLVNKYGRNAADIAAALGKSDSYIRRLLRIYALPPEILQSLRLSELTLKHAHWLTRLTDNPAALQESYNRAVSEKMSSRDLETLVSGLTAEAGEDEGYSFFSPKIITTKAGSRLRFEPRRRSVRVELNINLDEPIDVILAEIKRNLKKLAKNRLRVVG